MDRQLDGQLGVLKPPMRPIFCRTEKAFAKINLTLNVTGRRPDGYHELETIMQTVSLYDDVELRICDRASAGRLASQAFGAADDVGAVDTDVAVGVADEAGVEDMADALGAEGARVFVAVTDEWSVVSGQWPVNSDQWSVDSGQKQMTAQSSIQYPVSSIQLAADARPVESIPADRRNTAYRAAEEFLAMTGLRTRALDIHIGIVKRIPAAAGLGGGSADAAAVLRALNAAAGTLGARPLDGGEMLAAAARVGADVPFCLRGGASLATGIGEILSPIPPLPPEYAVVLVTPPFAVSTAWVFGNFTLPAASEIAGLSKITRSMVKLNGTEKDAVGNAVRNTVGNAVGNTVGNAANGGAWNACFNVLESVTLARWPQVGRLKARLTDAGAVCAVMSGSGPTVFGLFSDGRAARAAADAAREDGCWAAVCEAVGPLCQL